jgi:hypothetical protein
VAEEQPIVAREWFGDTEPEFVAALFATLRNFNPYINSMADTLKILSRAKCISVYREGLIIEGQYGSNLRRIVIEPEQELTAEGKSTA